MRRLALVLTLSGAGALAALCVAGLLLARSADGLGLVLPGATNVQISGRGTPRLNITYDLPRNKRLYNLNQHMRYQGWRRITLENYDRSSSTFVRVRLFGLVREIVMINLRPPQRRRAEIGLVRCVRIRHWVRCL
jgi:hypothetical protein